MERILIIAGALHLGGAERIAANISSYAPANSFEFHYAVFEGYENVYGPEIEARGGRIITLPSPKAGYLRYCRTLAALIRENRYSVVHSHTQFNSGINLSVARLLKVPVRIAHSHTTKTEIPVSPAQKAYEALMRALIRRNATHLMACGEEAGEWMFGKRAFARRGILLKNGIDTEVNAYCPEYRAKLRQALGLGADAFVVGHAGTLIPLKNQIFLIRLMPMLRQRRPKAVLLLLGAGDPAERSRLEAEAQALGVGEAVIFTGGVTNVHEYLSAMDVFAFPSLREGTPLALLEAQANGLPCVISDRIPADARLTELITALPLERPEAWVEALSGAVRRDPAAYQAAVQNSGYDFHTAYAPLYGIYRSIASVSFSFDDGRGDNTPLADRVFLPMGLPMTLNITTGYVDGSCPPENLPCDRAPMTRAEVQRLSASPGIEIAMHGDRHQNSPEDIRACRKKLGLWLELPEDRPLGFASPNSAIPVEELQAYAQAEPRDGIAYLRISQRILTHRLLRILCRRAARILHLPVFCRIAFHDTVMTAPEGRIMYSVPVMRGVTARQLLAVVRDAVRRRGALVLMFHSVEPEPPAQDNWSWSQEEMQRLCEAVRKLQNLGRLEARTTMEQFRQLQERD